jgi:UPF0716 family protein affecting phage T7 exclusion
VLTVVLAVAVIGIAMLAVAVLTGNTIVALLVIAIAALGLVLLARDWLGERSLVDARGEDDRRAAGEAENGHPPVAEHHAPALEPDEYQPDVLYEEPDAPRPDATS